MVRLLTLMLGMLLWSLASGSALAAEAAPNGAMNHAEVSGVVTRIQSNVIFAKTPWGRLTVGTTKDLGDVKVGDRLTIWLNEHNSVIDVHKAGDTRPAHVWLSGHLVYTTPAKNEIRLWTPEGRKDFPVDSSAVGKLNAVAEGAPITVEINERGRVIDVQPLTITVDVARWDEKA